VVADQPLGIAVIGLGMAAGPHARSLVELQAEGVVDVMGAWSRSAARRERFTATFNLPVTSDLSALLARPGLKAALLLTPPDARESLVEQIAAAGLHILCEKPLERTTTAARRIVATCDAAGIRLGVVFQHRFRAGAERLRALLEAGRLGAIAHVELAVPWWRPQAYYDEPGRGTLARDGGGVLITQAIHQLDLMLSLVGPIAEVAAIAGTTRLHRMESEDLVAAGLVFANGALGSLLATTAAYPGHPERLVITGTEGSATLAGGTLEIAWIDGRIERHGESTASGGGADPMAFPHDWHKAVIQDFAAAIRDNRPPRITGEDALRIHHLIDALLASAREGRRVAVVSSA
jgi:predicted dehydrogenase